MFRGLNNRRFNDLWAWRWNGALHLSAQQLGGGGLLPGFGHVDDRSSWLPIVDGIRNYRLWNRFRHRRWRGGSLHLVAQGVGHGVISGACVPDLAADFIEAASIDGLDASCLERLRRPPFFLSAAGTSP